MKICQTQSERNTGFDMTEDIATFETRGYSSYDAGYPVFRTWPLDNGTGRGGCRIASFVCGSEAKYFAAYCNNQLDKHDTTDMQQWD